MNQNDLIIKGCYNYLGAYASYMEHEFERPSHIKVIIDALTKLEAGEITRLIITMPPRHGKSMLTSKIFPTWFLGRHPNKNVIFTTYGQEFAEDFGRYVRNTIQRPEFLNIFPNATLSTDSTSIKRFALDAGGNYFAVGAGGSITGRGADCLVGETMVYTENGAMRLDHLHQLQYNGKVLSFNHELNKYEYRYIQASRCIPQKQVIKIQTCRGNSIYITAEHKIYIKGKGYIEAKLVKRGDEIIFQSKNYLQLLWQRIFNNKIRTNKKNKKRIQKSLLFKILWRITSCNKKFKTMLSLWKEKINKKKEILFRTMQTSYNTIFQKEIKKDLCWMSETIYAQGTSTDILQSKMFLQECRAARKWDIQSNKISSNILKKIKTFDKRARSKLLCFMQETKRSLCTSYRRKCYEQFIRKFNNFMSSMPYIRTSRNRTTITDVIFDYNEQHNVYDIQVEGNNNFFANGILVHNCAIIDDPFRNRQEANSVNVRRRVIDWFKSTLFTRLSPTGSIIIIQTRWHEEDLAGYILQNEPEAWTHLNLPAISEDGHALWPENWPLEKLEKIKASIGSYEWAALYQQRPAPADGGMFAKTWFEIVNAVPKTNITSTVRYWDRAATIQASGKDPDWTVGIKMSKDRSGVYYIEDMVRLRNTSLEVQKAIMNTASRDGYNVKVVLEQDPGQAGKSEVEYLIRLLSGYNVKPNRVSRDKVTRAMPFSAQCEAGNIKLLKAGWNETFLEELSMFPFGAHDDIVDASSGAFLQLTSPTLNYENLVRM